MLWIAEKTNVHDQLIHRWERDMCWIVRGKTRAWPSGNADKRSEIHLGRTSWNSIGWEIENSKIQNSVIYLNAQLIHEKTILLWIYSYLSHQQLTILPYIIFNKTKKIRLERKLSTHLDYLKFEKEHTNVRFLTLTRLLRFGVQQSWLVDSSYKYRCSSLFSSVKSTNTNEMIVTAILCLFIGNTLSCP